MRKPLRVLIAAENASVRLGGEAILPYHYFRLLRERLVDAHMVVHARSRRELVTLFPKELDRMHFVEDTVVQQFFFFLGRLLPSRLNEATLGLATQMITQWRQRAILRRLATARCVVHQPIPVSPRFPSAIYDVGSPVVVGPLNGGMEYPPAFRKKEPFLSRCVLAFCRMLSYSSNVLLPGKRRASFVLVANNRTRAVLPAGLQGQVLELPENAVDLAQWQAHEGAAEPARSRFLFVGRLVDWKALDVVIHALRDVAGGSLDVIGDGPMLESWRNLALQAGVADRVRFLGWLSQKDCAERLNGCCALVLPSLYECGGAVVLEAMAMARPVIATAWGGPAEYLDETCGVLIEPANRADLIAGFARAMSQMQSSPELATRLGAAGRERLLRGFTWSGRVDRMLEIYGMAAQ